MIIDKLDQYWTEELNERLKGLQLSQSELAKKFSQMAPEQFLEEWEAIDGEIISVRDAVEDRYIKNRGKPCILKDVKEIVSAIEKEDYLEDLKRIKIFTATVIEKYPDNEQLRKSMEVVVEGYDSCLAFIIKCLKVQIAALLDDDTAINRVIKIAKARVSLWYIDPNPAYLPLAHGRPTDSLAFVSSKDAITDIITGDATIDRLGVQIVILKLEELKGTLGISTDKLLSYALSIFTNQNDFSNRKEKAAPKREVVFSLREYAKLLGYDVDEHETGTPAEAEKEKKRAKNQLDNARKAIQKDLTLLQASTIRWEEKIKGKLLEFDSISLVTRVQITRDGQIHIFFTPEIANYLIERNLITQYPVKLLGLDGRDRTPYYIGRKLTEHYYMDSNQIRGTHDRISIPALLAISGLSSYEEVQAKDRGHWAERIKEPLEKALDTLTQEGIIKDWEYTHAKGIALTDEEARNILSYEQFAELYLHFTLAETVDNSERISKKREARAKAIKRKARKKNE